MLARAIDELGIQDRTILISPVGCSVFAYYYFDVGNIQAAHGRAPAVATAARRSRPRSIVISYQGDGDLSAIGAAEILHAANRGENITVLFVNNAIYSMTGGQAAPTTLIGQKSTDLAPAAAARANEEGHPLHVSELLATLQACRVYIERVGLGDNKQIAQAARSIRRASENQVARPRLLADRSPVSLPCFHHLEDVAWSRCAALGARCHGEDLPARCLLRDRTKEAERGFRAELSSRSRRAALPAICDWKTQDRMSQQCRDQWAAGSCAPGTGRAAETNAQKSGPAARTGRTQHRPTAKDPNLRVRVAGFGGQASCCSS